MTDERIKEELKPCPFCGGSPYFVDAQHTHAGVDMIVCPGCGCRVYSGTADKWNTRAPERLAKIEALEEVRIKITLLDTIVPDNVVFSHYMQGQVDLNKEALKAIDSMIAELKEEGE
jgi:hypothetical protein